MKFRSKAIALAALAVIASAAHADAPSMFSFSGFGTVGVANADTDKGDYLIPGQNRGAGASHGTSGEVDSKLGAQATAKLSDVFSATVQATTRQTVEGDWLPGVNWAFGKAKFGGGLSARVGRIGTPFFIISDFRDVGFANTTVRPPMDVYGQVPNFGSFDGGDLLWNHAFGDTTVNAQVFAGQTKFDWYSDSSVKFRDLVGLNVTVEHGPVTFRMGHAEGKLTLENHQASAALLAGLRQASLAPVPGAAALAPLADQLAIADKKASFSGVGLSVDWNNVIASGEYTKRRTASYLPDTTGWYVLGGYRAGSFTPYATYSKVKRDDANATNLVPTFPGVPALAAFSQLHAGVDMLMKSQDPSQHTVGAGLRWDAVKNVAVKVQYERIKVNAGSTGFFTNVTGDMSAEPINVYSLAVDFVW